MTTLRPYMRTRAAAFGAIVATMLAVSGAVAAGPSDDAGQVEWIADGSFVVGGSDQYTYSDIGGRMNIIRSPGTDEFTIVINTSFTSTSTSGLMCTVTTSRSFEGSGRFSFGDLQFTGDELWQRASPNCPDSFNLGPEDPTGNDDGNNSVTVRLGESMTLRFHEFEFELSPVAEKMGSGTVVEDTVAGPTEAEDDSASGGVIVDEELAVAPPATPYECLLAESASRDIIGVITATSGNIEIQHDVMEDFKQVTAGSIEAQADPSLVASTFLVRQGDIVRARSDSSARMVYFEQAIPLARLADSQGAELSSLLEAGTAEIDILSETVICLGDHVDQAEPASPILDIVNGVIRWTTDRWLSGTAFTTRPGTTILGIRGTEFVVGYDAATGTATVLVNDGSVEMVSAGDRVLVAAGHWVVSRDGVGIVDGPTVTEPSGFATVLDSTRPLSALTDLTDEGDSSPLPVIGAVIGAGVIGLLIGTIAVRRRTRRRAI